LRPVVIQPAVRVGIAKSRLRLVDLAADAVGTVAISVSSALGSELTGNCNRLGCGPATRIGARLQTSPLTANRTAPESSITLVAAVEPEIWTHDFKPSILLRVWSIRSSEDLRKPICNEILRGRKFDHYQKLILTVGQIT
jgi:hypothetical protein